ncbi:Kinesin-like protein KIF20B [Hypsizygus marmoreus]|uniref:Kinesin-like protein KIF20B n=1 Tax=Hypsizygus marmoreus TaxID=39966 RepID=A0A369K5E3_HYPMA|nr:Kinesin-like protein KIF20B [Hypsizygus marmoreus]
MASKPAATTRASSRTKVAVTVAPSTTRTTRARAATTKAVVPPAPSSATATTAKRAPARKPLVNRENSVGAVSATKTAPKAATTRRTAKQAISTSDADREPLMVRPSTNRLMAPLTTPKAYLRIRPHLGDDEPMVQPYLQSISDISVRMTDPNESQSKPSRFRPSALPPSSIYTFSHVFPSNTSQSDFFTKTTLPLVRDVLQGQSGLLFTYGVTNSGKTYTVQGGNKEGSAGILPRTLDVMFNSIEGLHGDGRFRPIRLQGVEPADPSDSKAPQIMPEPALAEVFGQHLDVSAADSDIDPTILKIDRNYEYTIWLSYAEVYNERVYDLLASVKDDSNLNPDGTIPRSGGGKSIVLTRTALPLKPSPASDNGDSATTGKYISGLRQFRVHTASQAKALVKLGQLHRRVFGTLANRESSRSHGMVIIKVVKGHRGERDDPTSLQISRLTLVDLAGSERTKHTHTTGDRLKEAGNINKSLMVLGQCMEVMRSNQRKLAMSLSQEGSGKDGRMDTRDVKRGLAVVPFRHSKLTEALMDYFIGDGKAVMIVNVNPYDTGYDENSHVMKFAALAREVYVTPAPAPVHRMKGPGKTTGITIKSLGPLTLNDPEILPNPHRRKVTISMGGPGNGKRASEAILEVLEEDEPNEGQDEDGSDDDPDNPLVDALFDEVEDLRMQLFESEMRCAIVEAETREEVMREMEARMRTMEEMYSRRLMNELEQNELKTDAKIDMLHQSGLFGSPVKKSQNRRPLSDLSEEENDVEMSLIEHGTDDNEETGSGTESALRSDGESGSERSRSLSMSPLARKGKNNRTNLMQKEIREVHKFVPDQPLPSDNEDAELTETDQGDDKESVAPSGTTGSDFDEDEDEDEEYHDDDEDDDDYEVPQPRPTKSSSSHNKTPKAKKTASPTISPSHRVLVKSQSAAQRPAPTNKSRVSKLAHDMDELTLSASADESVIILPVKKGRAPASNFVDDDESDEEVPVPKKKKRQLGKKPVMTEEQIEKATSAVERNIAKSESGKNIRRLTGR